MHWMLLPLKRYAEFDGRSRRKEFWMFFLLNAFVYIIAGLMIFSSVGFEALMADELTDNTAFEGIGVTAITGTAILVLWVIGTLIPNIAIAVRRFHDRNMSGWWYLGVIVGGNIPGIGFLIYIAYLVFMALPGTEGANRFGEDPKDAHAAEVFS